MEFLDIKHHGAVNGITGSCHELRFKKGAGLLIDVVCFKARRLQGRVRVYKVAQTFIFADYKLVLLMICNQSYCKLQLQYDWLY